MKPALPLLDQEALGERVFADHPGALEFLRLWAVYVHGIDDLVDGDLRDKQRQIGLFMLAAELYTHPFFQEHWRELRQTARNITLLYAQSVEWEQSPVEWQRQWSDVHRHAGNLMVQAVASITLGYAAARALATEIHSAAWHEHHDRTGTPN